MNLFGIVAVRHPVHRLGRVRRHAAPPVAALRGARRSSSPSSSSSSRRRACCGSRSGCSGARSIASRRSGWRRCPRRAACCCCRTTSPTSTRSCSSSPARARSGSWSTTRFFQAQAAALGPAAARRHPDQPEEGARGDRDGGRCAGPGRRGLPLPRGRADPHRHAAEAQPRLRAHRPQGARAGHAGLAGECLGLGLLLLRRPFFLEAAALRAAEGLGLFRRAR